MPAVRRLKDPQFVRLNITPRWFGIREVRMRLLPAAIAIILEHELRPSHREIRIHLEGIELEVLNIADQDLVALGSDLQAKIGALSTAAPLAAV